MFRKAKKVLEETPTNFGYVIRKEIWPDVYGEGESECIMTTCYTNNGDWIGDLNVTKILCEDREIAPEHINPVEPGLLVPCQIGFCESEQKWYGWSHRAIYGFGIGSKIERGDCGYQPRNAMEFINDMIHFYFDPKFHESVDWSPAYDNGLLGVNIIITYNNKAPNKKIHGTTTKLFYPYPATYGRGPWVAETLEDARQMACDFAKDVS